MPPGPGQHTEKRREPRADVELPVQIYEPGGTKMLAAGSTVNLSPGGMLAECFETDQLPPGAMVDIHVGLPSADGVEPEDCFPARVVRVQAGEQRTCAVEVIGRPPPFLFAPELVGKHPSIGRVKADVLKVADYDINVLIQGETGTGKNVLAELIHRYSRRAAYPCLRVNCPSIPPSLVESELFGHEKGAFTDARTSRPGLFRLADEGTIVLDEISSIPTSLQAKLLQAIEQKQFIPVGGSKPVKVKTRIISITNENLEAAIREGRFRADLYHRLNEAPVELPALRDRPSDIPLLVDYFLRRYAAEFGKEYRPAADDLLRRLASCQWPGNVRELSNCVKYGVLTGNFRLPEAGAPEPFTPGAAAGQEPDDVRGLTMKEARDRAVEHAERLAIVEALADNRHNRTRAAKALGVSYRTLLRKIQRYDIDL